MSYSVVWSPDAERDLTELWLASRSRHLIASAADQIDDALTRDPLNAGESRDAEIRIVFVSPLAAEFEIVESVRTVFVHAVWSY